MSGFESIGRPHPSAQIRIERALAELRKRGVENDHCPRCVRFDWNVDIVDIPANSQVARVRASLPWVYTQQPTGILSVLGVVCKKCGYTMFHNMAILGL